MKKSIFTIIFSAIVAVTAVAVTALSAAPSPQAGEGRLSRQTSKEPAKPKVKPYKLDTCIVTDDKLGEMGDPIVFIYKDQEIKLCCKACRKKFDKAPATYLKKLDPKK